MNNLFLKVLGLFVILLFCLSPLGAIDLGQGDNATHLNDNNGTVIKDVNDTIKVNDSDIEIKSVNETDVDLENDKDVEIQKVSSNDSNSSLKLKGEDPQFHIKVDDINYGQKPILKFWTNNKYFSNDNVKIIISGPDYSSESTLHVHRDTNEYKLNEDLAPGTYRVSLVYGGSRAGYFDPTTVEDYFTVKKLKTNLKANVNDIELGEKPVVKVSCDEGLDGNITISSNFTKSYNFPASKGSFDYEFDEDLAPGNYYCVVSYSGDKIHDSAISCSFFTVNKHDPNMAVTVNDIRINQKAVVKIKANESINGNVKVDVKGPKNSDWTVFSGDVELVDGVGSLTVNKDLLCGNYTAIASFDGDDTFKASEKSTEFTVNQIRPF